MNVSVRQATLDCRATESDDPSIMSKSGTDNEDYGGKVVLRPGVTQQHAAETVADEGQRNARSRLVDELDGCLQVLPKVHLAGTMPLRTELSGKHDRTGQCSPELFAPQGQQLGDACLSPLVGRRAHEHRGVPSRDEQIAKEIAPAQSRGAGQ
jgi:hypothetical protein